MRGSAKGEASLLVEAEAARGALAPDPFDRGRSIRGAESVARRADAEARAPLRELEAQTAHRIASLKTSILAGKLL